MVRKYPLNQLGVSLIAVGDTEACDKNADFI